MQVRREARDDEPLVGILAEQRPHRGADRRLRRREARTLGVRRVGHEEADPALAARDVAEHRQIGATPVDRREVELEVAAVHDGADRREERDREAVRNRVRDRDELAVDRTDPAALTVGNRNQLGAIEHARFFDAIAGERERQLRAIDRNGDVTEQERDPARVVFVGVREQDRVDPVGVLPKVREVGEDQIDTGHVGVGKHDPAVDEEDAIVDLDAAAVAADLTQPAQEDDPHFPLIDRRMDRVTRAAPCHRPRSARPAGLCDNNGAMHERGFLIDRATQAWVRATGRTVRLGEHRWLDGPIGSPTFIGDEWLPREARRLDADLHDGGGLLESFDLLAGEGFDPSRLSPAIVDFYERTSEWRLDAWSQWCPAALPGGWLLSLVFAQRLQQLALPLRPLDVAQGMDSRVVSIRRPDGAQLGAAWLPVPESALAGFKTSPPQSVLPKRVGWTVGQVMYSGWYGRAQLPDTKDASIRVMFPLPNGSVTVFLRPSG